MLHDDAPSTPLVKGWERGQQCFNAPLVILWNTDDGGYDENSWKAIISRWFGARGLRLTRKLIAAGYDGIVTVKKTGAGDFLYTSEIVSLAIPLEASRGRKVDNPMQDSPAYINSSLAYHIKAYDVRGNFLLVTSHPEAIEFLEWAFPNAEWARVNAIKATQMFCDATEWAREDVVYTLCAPLGVRVETEEDMLIQLNMLTDALEQWERDRANEGKKLNPSHAKRMMNPRNY
jgi:hypothetical protein